MTIAKMAAFAVAGGVTLGVEFPAQANPGNMDENPYTTSDNIDEDPLAAAGRCHQLNSQLPMPIRDQVCGPIDNHSDDRQGYIVTGDLDDHDWHDSNNDIPDLPGGMADHWFNHWLDYGNNSPRGDENRDASVTGPSVTGPSDSGPSVTGPSDSGPSDSGPSVDSYSSDSSSDSYSSDSSSDWSSSDSSSDW
ncbi:hypothetical protein [Mycobacterium montefiorense]|uniref:hypothetical protein n=1 Tax=Mycobacterium montefiorense TaxID=154654 RepID=UPI0021F289E7|nr:hypothetical protein [Mycobacterium montefiorense]MCV7429858.1 hypothetical protein [Mycobacterium montefiorense]